MLKLKNESELRNRGQALDTRNPNQAVPLSRLRESQEDAKEEGPTKAEPRRARGKGGHAMLRLADVKELVKRFDQHYNAARTANSDLHALHRRRTQAYWELGKAASEIKSGLGHGKFLPFLKSRGDRKSVV